MMYEWEGEWWKHGKVLNVKLAAMMLCDSDAYVRRARIKTMTLLCVNRNVKWGAKTKKRRKKQRLWGERGGGERSEKQMETEGRRRKDVLDGEAGGTRWMGVEKR